MKNTKNTKNMPRDDSSLPERDYCAMHEVEEPTTTTTYRVCWECGHVYETEEDLVKERLAYFDEEETSIALKAVKGQDILFCPLCLHDF